MTQDFERAWLGKLAKGLDSIAGEELRQEIMEGGDTLSGDSDPQHITSWTNTLMNRMTTLMDEERARAVMASCACEYPKSDLQPLRVEYERTKDVSLVHQMMQERFESFLRDTLERGEELTAKVLARGWGVAGELKGDTIISTKIPKSGNLVKYFEETDPATKRRLYCHCPRMGHVFQTSGEMPQLYCFCGAGFYKGIWEEILQKPVEVEVLETVLSGGEVCRIAIHLPPDA
jgi:hypothetical protein